MRKNPLSYTMEVLMSYDSFHDNNRASSAAHRSRASAQARRERQRKLMIRRTVIVVVGLLIVTLAIVLVVKLAKAMFGGDGGNNGGNNGVISETVKNPFGDLTPTTEGETAEPTEAPTESPLSFKTPAIHDDGVTTGQFSYANRGVYIYDGMSCELFGWYDGSAADYCDAISEFKKLAPEFTVYNMIVPNHTEFALPRRLIDTVGTMIQSENIKAIYSGYSADVQPINCYNKLCDHISEYIYFNTDHHWSGLGAYYAYTAFCEQTGQTALKLSDCTQHTITDFEGTLYDSELNYSKDTVYWWQFPYDTHAMRQDSAGESLYRTTVFYEQEDSGPYSYGVFIWGDAPLFVCYNDELNNGKKIAVVKESYGNAFAPFLTANYEEVHVIDFRYFEGSLKQYMKDNGIDEVIFVNNVMSANTAIQVDRIRGIF